MCTFFTLHEMLLSLTCIYCILNFIYIFPVVHWVECGQIHRDPLIHFVPLVETGYHSIPGSNGIYNFSSVFWVCPRLFHFDIAGKPLQRGVSWILIRGTNHLNYSEFLLDVRGFHQTKSQKTQIQKPRTRTNAQHQHNLTNPHSQIKLDLT